MNELERKILDAIAERKLAPRPRHPKADPAAQAAFKKSCAARYAERSGARLRPAAGYG